MCVCLLVLTAQYVEDHTNWSLEYVEDHTNWSLEYVEDYANWSLEYVEDQTNWSQNYGQAFSENDCLCKCTIYHGVLENGGIS